MGSEKLSKRDVWTYGIGELPIALLSVTISSYIQYYYTDVIGLSVALAGTIVMICRVIEVAASPITGILVDRTNTKYGKARPFLRYTFLPTGIFFFLTFTQPGFAGKSGWYYLLTYALFCVAYNVFVASYIALFSCITRNPDERLRLNQSSVILYSFGNVAMALLLQPLVKQFGKGDEQHGFMTVAAIFSVITVICLYICYRFSHERATSSEEKQRISLKEGFGAAVKNRQWLILCFIRCMSCMTWQMRNQGAVYYAKYYLEVPDYSGYMLTGIMLSSVLVGFLITPLARRIGNRNCIVFGFAMNILVTVGFYLVGKSIVGLCICSFLSGIGTNLGTTLFPVICAGQIDETERQTGVRPQGIMTSFINVSNGAGSVLSALVITLSLSVSHYTTQGPVTDTMIGGIRFIFIVLPVIFAAITMVAALYLHDDRIHRRKRILGHEF